MERIDTHQHFWQYDTIKHSWITDEMKVIRRDFLPGDLAPLLKENGLNGCVAVQADQSEEETDFLLMLAEKNDFIKGVVGWIDLQTDDIEERLTERRRSALLKGFRHILQDEKDRAFMLNRKFMVGIEALKKHNFTYDILVFPDQLEYTEKFVELFPDHKFVLDHIAKPYVKEKKLDEWSLRMKALGKFKNLYCKISGLVTEADWANWKEEDFVPYIDVVVESFGIERIMFGSDWPVCLVAGSYSTVTNIAKNYFSTFSEAEQQKFFSGNAIDFYHLT